MISTWCTVLLDIYICCLVTTAVLKSAADRATGTPANRTGVASSVTIRLLQSSNHHMKTAKNKLKMWGGIAENITSFLHFQLNQKITVHLKKL